MKSKKRKEVAAKKAEQKRDRGKSGRGKSDYALKQKVDNRPGSPFKTVIVNEANEIPNIESLERDAMEKHFKEMLNVGEL